MDKTVNIKWLKAAVIGSIWAAVEIIVGSFLHNLRIPFAGAFLAMAGVFLLSAFMRHWDDKYIILRAGIICALMKSVSPSAIIFGPMVGIFTEALLLETARLVFGRNLFAFMLGGAFAVLFTLFQKVLNWLILYGFDLVKIAESLYDFLVMKTGFAQLSPAYLIGSVFVLYAAAGAVAAFAGYKAVGAERQKQTNKHFSKSDFEKSNFFSLKSEQKFSLYLLPLIILWAAVVLYLLNTGYWFVALMGGLAFLVFILMRYKQSVRHLKKPAIWIQFIIITFIASFLWDKVSGGEGFSFAGLRAGLEMNFRAVIIIFGFAGISSELRNPFLKTLLNNYGLSNLYRALGIAFSALPVVAESLPQFKNVWRRRRLIIRDVLSQADALLHYFYIQTAEAKHIWVITGDLHSGKTSYVRELVNRLKDKGLQIKGLLSPGEFDNNRRSIFRQQNILSGESVVLAVTEPHDNWLAFSRFWFNPEVLEAGNCLLKNVKSEDTDILVLDEVGPMEMKGLGRADAIPYLLDKKEILQLWVVRRKLVHRIVQKWHLDPAQILDIETVSIEEAANILRNNLQIEN